MSLGKNREEQELTRKLAATLVQKEVIEPMNKIGWVHGTPPPPDYSGQPAPTEGAPAPAPAAQAAPAGGQPAPGAASPAPAAVAPAKADAPSYEQLVADLESLRDSNGLIAGKYKTVAAAFQGMGHLATMAKQSFKERDEAIKRLETIGSESVQARPQPVASPAAAPAAPPATLTASRAALKQAQTRLDEVLSNVEANGDVVDAETLRKVNSITREVAEHAADVRVQENLFERESAEKAERSKWLAVDSYMEANHPESLKHSDEIGLHIQSNPLLQKAVSALVAQGNLIEASELAWESYERAVSTGAAVKEVAQAQAKEADLAAKGQVRQELVEKARIDAGVIHGSAGGQGIHERTDAAGASPSEIAALQAQMRMEGDAPGSPAATRFRHLVIGRTLDPSIFGAQ